MMKRIRIEKRARRPVGDRHEVLPVDPRDAEVLRAKQLARSRRA